VAIGSNAGVATQGASAIAIGNFGGRCGQVANSIVLNASGVQTDAANVGFYVNPVRTLAAGSSALNLAVSSNEIVINSDKTFIVDHPLAPETHYVVHACVEGPEVGVYYRGEILLLAGKTSVMVDLPEYIAKIAKDFTVSLTNCEHFVMPMVTRVAERRFTIQIEQPALIDLCFFWHLMGKRRHIETQVAQPTVIRQLLGGPYRWL
jgi:hypothetical protein